MSLSTTISVNLLSTLAGTSGSGAQNQSQISAQTPQPWAGGTIPTGTGSAKADQRYTSQITLAAAASTDLDLTSLGNNELGATISMVTVKAIMILMQGNTNCGIVSAVAINAAGTGYAVNDVLTVAGGTGTSATLKVTSVSSGAITGLSVLTPGSYTVNPSVTGNAVTGGSGTTATVNLTMATATGGTVAFVEGDYLTVGGDGTSNGWVSFLAANTYTMKVYSGNATMPGFLVATNFSNTGWVVGSTNKLFKLTNSGSNPVTFTLILTGASA